MPDPVDEPIGQVARVHAVEKRPLDVHGRYHDGRLDFLTTLESHARNLAISHQDTFDARVGTELTAIATKGAGDRVGYRTHTAARVTPGTDIAVDIPHVMMQ